MAKSKKGKGNGSNGSIIGVIIGIIVAFVVIICLAIISFFYGTIQIVQQFIGTMTGIVAEVGEHALDWIKHIFGVSRIVDGMYIYPLEKDSITQLKQQFDAQGIDTEKTGMTDIMLRKMILTQAVTSFTKDTLCVAEVSEDEILQNTGYTNINEYFKSLDKKSSSDVWPIKCNYNLYYITDSFFYFKDTDDIIQQENKYYLGLIGTINLESSDGTELEYVSQEEFNLAEESTKTGLMEEQA